MPVARDNPFAVHRVLRERYRLDESGWAVLLSRLDALRHRGAIVGPHGSGKTTLLEDLAERLEARGVRMRWVRLSSEARVPRRAALDAVGPGQFVLVDGAEQLASARWWLLRWRTRRAAGLVITTHRAGRLPTLWRCSTTPELLSELVGSLRVDLDPADARALHARHRGNLRDALRELYDRHASASGLVRRRPGR